MPSSKGFNSEDFQPYLKKLLNSILQGSAWNDDADTTRRWTVEIGRRVKERMLEIQPKGFKYIVTVHINENLGQAGRAGLSSHWEETDMSFTEIWSNDSLVCVLSAFALRCY
ncbi:Dynein light chain [Phaffia rhodozyma]|uniref:Dynein light chain n=1 Tax=Phaffia rhodozyma TaxID=264483 RepID=A0A0F7SGM9_PHARH|nr:Dynein light chain [Phaffia rhodozyma]